MQQLVRRDAGGAEFADHDAGCSIRESRGIGERRSRGGGQCEHTEHRVACAGHIENLAAVGAVIDSGFSDARVRHFETRRRNVQRLRRRFLQQRHSLFPASDQHGFASEMREQLASGIVERFVVSERLRKKLAGFFGVADDGFRPAIGVKLASVSVQQKRGL